MPAATQTPQPAVPVPDHELIRPIGRGSYGEVWLARNVLGEFRAVKLVRQNGQADDRPLQREFEGLEKFEPISRGHEGLVQILHVGRLDDGFYYVMELADPEGGSPKFDVRSPKEARNPKPEPPARGRVGGASPSGPQHSDFELPSDFGLRPSDFYSPRTLRSELHRRGRLPVAECVGLGLDLTSALEHLHGHGLVHRDIKPSNIIFVRGRPKLADIGLVASADASMSCVGTEGYLPPEGPGQPPADLYALGKVLYELATGRDRTEFPELPTLLREDPHREALEELNEVILKACAPEARRRYRTATEMHADLGLLQRGRSLRWARLISRRLAFTRVAGSIAGGIAALTAGAFWFQRQQTRVELLLRQRSEDLAARWQIQHAESLFARGDSSSALAHLAHVLRHHPDHRVAAERTMAALTQRRFPRLMAPPWVHGAKLDLASYNRPAHLSPDGTCVVGASGDHTVRLWDFQTGQEAMPPYQHGAIVFWVEFSPDGRRAISASGDGTACLLDTQTGEPVFPPLQHGGAVRAARFDPSGRFAATASADALARVFRADTGELLQSWPHGARVNSVAFSPDGDQLATASEEPFVRIWEIKSGRLAHRLETTGVARHVRFSPNGEWLAATVQSSESGDWEVPVWEAESGRPLRVPLPHRHRLYGLAFSPDNRRLATATADNAARVWELPTGRERFQLPHRGLVYATAFSLNGQQILTASADHTVRLWDSSTGAEISEPMRHDARLLHAEFSLDGKHILTVGWQDRAVKLWSIPPDLPGIRSLPHRALVGVAGFDSTGTKAITATVGACSTAKAINRWHLDQQSVIVWDTESRSAELAPTLPPRVEALAVHLGKTGARALVVERLDRSKTGASAWVWDLAKAGPLGGALRHEANVTAACFDAGGLRLATGTADGAARTWGAQHGAPVSPVLRHQGRINSVRFSPDGRWLLTGSDDRTAALWDAVTGDRLARLPGHGDGVWFADFSPQGDRLVTGSLDHAARIWSTDGTLLVTLRHQDAVEHAEFSPDGAKLVTSSGDQTARLWSVASGLPLTEPLQHGELVLTARFSTDGLRVVTASQDGTAQVWDVATGLKLTEPLRHADWVVSATFSPDGRRVITASMDRTAGVWEVPIAPSPVPGWLAGLAEAVAGQRLGPARIPEPVSWAEYAELRERLTRNPGSDNYSQWATRFLSAAT